MAGMTAWQVETLVGSERVRQLYYALRNAAAREKQKPERVEQWMSALNRLHAEMLASGGFPAQGIEEYVRQKK